jgi:hypothetical protein
MTVAAWIAKSSRTSMDGEAVLTIVPRDYNNQAPREVDDYGNGPQPSSLSQYPEVRILLADGNFPVVGLCRLHPVDP